jgi:hypothetical protein
LTKKYKSKIFFNTKLRKRISTDCQPITTSLFYLTWYIEPFLLSICVKLHWRSTLQNLFFPYLSLINQIILIFFEKNNPNPKTRSWEHEILHLPLHRISHFLSPVSVLTSNKKTSNNTCWLITKESKQKSHTHIYTYWH